MVELSAHSLEINGKAWNISKAFYPQRPTIYSGVEVEFGAESCLEHPDPSTARVSLWLPKLYADWVPKISDEIKVTARIGTGTVRTTIFSGKIDSVVMEDDHKPAPTPYQPENMLDSWQSMTDKTGWSFTLSNGGGSNPYTDIGASVSLEGTNAFRIPVAKNQPNQVHRVRSPRFAVTPSQSYSFTVGQLPELLAYETITFARFYNAAGLLIVTTPFTGPANKGSFVPFSQVASMEFEIYFNLHMVDTTAVTVGDIKMLRMFSNEPLGDDPAGYRITLQCSDAIAEAGRLRIGDTPWTSEHGINRLNRIAELASPSGVKFRGAPTIQQGYYEMIDSLARARDVDSVNALEIYQDTAMCGGLTVGSIDNVVQLNYKLQLPKVLSQSGDVTVAEWLGTPHASKSVMKRNGVELRRNEASNPQGEESISRYSVISGGGSTQIGRTFDRQRTGNTSIRGTWNTAATSVGGVAYLDSTVSGAAGEKLSGGVWVRWNVSGEAVLQVGAFNGATQIAAWNGPPARPVVAGEWNWMSFENFTIPAAYTAIQVFPRLEAPMPNAGKQDLDGILIEKTAIAGEYFDGFSAGEGGVIITELKNAITGRPIPVIPVSAIVDDTFSIDTTDVISQIKIDYFVRYGTVAPDGEYNAVEDAEMTIKTGDSPFSPTQRVLKSESQVNDPGYVAEDQLDLDPVAALVIRAKGALAAQSHPRWRLSNGIQIVLKELPFHEGLFDLIEEAGRFGQLVRLEGAPELMDEYQRVRAGRIVLGDEPVLELELEPVDYSGPTNLSRNTAYSDPITRAVTLNDLQEISSDDLRSIGAR